MTAHKKNEAKPAVLSRRLSRREFLKKGVMAGTGGLALSCPGNVPAGLFSSASDELIRTAPRARYWISANAQGVRCLSCHTQDDKIGGKARFVHEEKLVKCLLCAQECLIREGERGKCRARVNVRGTLRSLVYGRPVTVHVDPIEKKPFYHFLPGTSAFSLATSGCPLKCGFCQNWEISQARPEDFPGKFIAPETIVRSAAERSAPVIAFTYNEPTVFAEYLTDIARAARKRNIRNVLISCGFMNQEPLTEMCDVLDAIKIDLKGFSRDFYRRVCGAELGPILRSIRQVARSGVHLEIVNLIVPTLNDSRKMLTELVRWVAGEVGPDVPLHFTRFHPAYQMRNLPPTPLATLELAYEIAKSEGLRYPYVGNVPGHSGNHTHCPGCGKTVIVRTGFFVMEKHLKNNCCGYCGEALAGVW